MKEKVSSFSMSATNVEQQNHQIFLPQIAPKAFSEHENTKKNYFFFLGGGGHTLNHNKMLPPPPPPPPTFHDLPTPLNTVG